MGDTVSTDLVVHFLRAVPRQRAAFERFLQATPEQRAAIERILYEGEAQAGQATTAAESATLPGRLAEKTVASVADSPAVPLDCKSAFAEILRRIGSVAEGLHGLQHENGQLRTENETLRAMQLNGAFGFVLDVGRQDFLDFAVIMAKGNRAAAADFLKVPQRSFYDRTERWKTLGKNYHHMWRWVQWRKAVGRKIKLRLPDSPEALHEVVTAIGESSSQNYPALLRQILEVLVKVNPKNCDSICGELVALIKEELPQ